MTVLVTGIIISSAITGNAKAQSYDKGVAFTSLKNASALQTYLNENNSVNKSDSNSVKESVKSPEKSLIASKENLKAAKANFRATENFKKTFKDAPEATWTVEENAIVASFSRDDVTTRVVYNKNGRPIHALSYYPADKTPNDVRSIVETDYPNANITLAVQVKENGMEFYIVQLEDKTTIKQIAVYDGSTNLIKEFTKIL